MIGGSGNAISLSAEYDCSHFGCSDGVDVFIFGARSNRILGCSRDDVINKLTMLVSTA